jgi:serine protease Do
MVIILSLSVGTGCFYSEVASPPPSTPPPELIAPAEPEWEQPVAIGERQPLPDFVSVIAKVKPSVVAINTEVVTRDLFNRQFTQEGAGSGWIIDEEGYIVTNNHVIEGAQSITVILVDGRAFSANIVGTDKFADLAVLKIDPENLPEAIVGDSDELRVGDWVIAIGNAQGEGISATSGIISRKGVEITVGAGQELRDLIQTDAAINPGNSGGPLVNMKCEVIGITSAKLAAIGVEGMGYAISSKTAMPIIGELIQKGYVVRPWLGIVVRDVDQFLKFTERLTVEEGAFVTQVGPESPAANAGIQQGDVIVSLGGEKITTSQQLIEVIHSQQVGVEVEITFWRGDSKMTGYTLLIENPPPS